MTIIDSETVVVYNYNELKTILEGNNTYSLIYFGDNITLAGGISIYSSKSNITIDGTYDNVRYTYTDYSSSSASQTIYLLGPSSMNITVQNIDVIGRNYYGIICIYETSNLSNVIVNYININYTGPQMAFNPYSSLNIIDCDITIQTGSSLANEVAETRNITLGGTVTINSASTSTALFWFRYVVGSTYPFFNVLPNSNVTIVGNSSYLYYLSSASYMNMTFGSNSNTNIETARGMGYDNSHRTNNVLIDSGATLNIEQKQQFGLAATWCVIGEFKMNSGASLKMISDYSGATGNYCLQFIGTSASFNLNNPSSIVFYNRPTNAISSSSTIPFTFNISQYNRWTTFTALASAGDIYDIPTYSWYKLENTNNLTVNGNITTSTTIITSTNLTSAEESELPNLNNFLINNTKVLSMGRPSLAINPITDTSTEISGATSPYADVRISYNSNDYYVQADNLSNYSYTYSIPLPIGTVIYFVSNVANSFLYRFRNVEVVFTGDINIVSATSQVTFSTIPFQTTPTLCNRSSALKVIVNDSRIYPTVWNLYAFINNALINEKGDTLIDGLVFVDEIGNMTVLSTTPTLVYTSDGISTGEIEVNWPNNEGILLQLNINPVVVNTTYKNDINWYIE